MKATLALFFFVLFSCPSVSFCQTISTPEEVIGRALETGVIDGHTIKMVGPMGDAAGVAVTRVVAERSLRPDEVQSILDILTESFADPRLVENSGDREPRAALFVLRYLDATATDSALKTRIAETRK